MLDNSSFAFISQLKDDSEPLGSAWLFSQVGPNQLPPQSSQSEVLLVLGGCGWMWVDGLEVNTICTYLHPRHVPITIQVSADISKSNWDLATLQTAQARATTSPGRSIFVGI